MDERAGFGSPFFIAGDRVTSRERFGRELRMRRHKERSSFQRRRPFQIASRLICVPAFGDDEIASTRMLATMIIGIAAFNPR